MTDLPEVINLDQCRFISNLGEGGFGQVFKIEYGSPSIDAALKMLKPNLSPVYITRFNTENDLLYQLIDHPGVINPYTRVAEQEGRNYYLMELADYDLQKFSDLPSTTTNEKLEIFYQICDAVKIAHGLKIVHRDMHYGNILIKEENSIKIAKLTDFGMAKVFFPEAVNLYTPGREWGRIDTRAPETYFFLEVIADFNLYTIRSDLYGLGMILYFLLGGMPFDYASSVLSGVRRYMNKAGVLNAISKNELSPPLFIDGITNDQKKCYYEDWLNSKFIPLDYGFEVFAPDLSEDRALKFQKIITKSCNIDSRNRYNSVTELLDEVRKI